MLMIGGVLITDVDHRILVRAFGYGYERDDRFDDWIERMIEDQRLHNYRSTDEMGRAFFQRNVRNHLAIQFEHPRYRAVTIAMTGSRQRDEEQANRLSGLLRTPENYTWHHCENIMRAGNGYSCRMILIETWYHQQPHTGGVHEYELLTNTRYR